MGVCAGCDMQERHAISGLENRAWITTFAILALTCSSVTSLERLVLKVRHGESYAGERLKERGPGAAKDMHNAYGSSGAIWEIWRRGKRKRKRPKSASDYSLMLLGYMFPLCLQFRVEIHCRRRRFPRLNSSMYR